MTQPALGEKRTLPKDEAPGGPGDPGESGERADPNEQALSKMKAGVRASSLGPMVNTKTTLTHT